MLCSFVSAVFLMAVESQKCPYFCSRCYQVIQITTETFNLFIVGDTEALNLHNILTIVIMIECLFDDNDRLIVAYVCPPPPPQ